MVWLVPNGSRGGFSLSAGIKDGWMVGWTDLKINNLIKTYLHTQVLMLPRCC